MLQHTEKYRSCLSVDLRCFDNSKPDLGVGAYFEKLGFLPDRLFNHETYMDQIHTHNGIIDDTRLEPQWVSQRAIPGAQMWTKRQFKALIDEVHRYGVEFYQGCEAAWSCWPEYGDINRCDYLYEHLPEIFIVDRTGRTSAQDGMGAINPLRRFKDGSLYEDLLIRDVKAFLIDYECDGFFAADGFAGLAVPLRKGCFADDMIEQFTEYTGIAVPEGTTPERADFIWSRYRYEWTVFYSDRWAAFSAKLSSSLKAIGKKLTTFTPWQLGPADGFAEYGYDYGKCARAGVESVALEIMEEVTSRRFQVAHGWEAVGICNAATAKAAAENLEILWTTSTCNCPEHWHTLRDQPVVIERECLALGGARAINSKGERIPIVDGTLTIFGIDLTHPEWRWLKRRWDEGFGYRVKEPLGPAIVWDDRFLYESLRRGKVYPVSQAVAKLRYAGIPVAQSIRLENVLQIAGKSLLLVQPIGIDDESVSLLRRAVEEGSALYVMGEVDNESLLSLLGLRAVPSDDAAHAWSCTDDSLAGGKALHGEEKGLGGYVAAGAQTVAELENGSVVLARRAVGKGCCVYLRRVMDSMPPVDVTRTAKELASYPTNLEEAGTHGITTIREQLESVITLHPDQLDLLAARLIQSVDPSLPVPDRGQLLGFEDEDGGQVLLVENSANLMYATVNVKLPGKKKEVQEFPEIKPIGPVGYVFFGDSEPDEFDVCVPPDAGIPVRIRYQD